jgi:hypothetical protein
VQKNKKKFPEEMAGPLNGLPNKSITISVQKQLSLDPDEYGRVWENHNVGLSVYRNRGFSQVDLCTKR